MSGPRVVRAVGTFAGAYYEARDAEGKLVGTSHSQEGAWRLALDLPPAPSRPSAKGWNLYRYTPCGTLAILVMTSPTRDGLFPHAVAGDQIQQGLKGPTEIV